MGRIVDSLKHAWNAFKNEEENRNWSYGEMGATYSSRPDRVRTYISNDRSIVSSIYTRLSVDAAGVQIRHVKIDDDERYVEDVKSGLNECLKIEPNIDQGARDLRQDIARTMIEKGVVAVVPVDTTLDPTMTGAWDVKTMRVGEILAWYPQHVQVRLYNEKRGLHEDITLPKRMCAIAYNPFYAVMNEQSSTLQRLIRKLNLLDQVDEVSASGKLDLIIQLPYVIKSDAKKQQAEQRRKDIEFQLKGSQYGIAYTDGTEKITQLNRPAENNLMKQVEYLTELLFSQLGLTQDIMNGTADPKVMLNYYNRTIEPILDAIIESMKRTFLTKTARSQGHSIMYFRDPFKLVPISEIADIADKLARNEIASANDIRTAIGWKPAKDPKADELRNSNMPEQPAPSEQVEPKPQLEGDLQNARS